MCGKPDLIVYPQRNICHATRERVAAQRRYAALHSEATGRVFHDGTETHWSPVATLDTPYRYDDGVSIWVADSDVHPDDHFLSSEGGDLSKDEAEGAPLALGDEAVSEVG